MRDEPRELLQVSYRAQSPLRTPRLLAARWRREMRLALVVGWQLFVRNLRTQYRQSVLGYVWALVPPLATTAVWVLLRQHDIVVVRSPTASYAAFVLTGMVLWLVFVDALQAPLRSVVGANALLTKVAVPSEALLLAGLGDVVFNFVVRLIVLIPLLLVADVSAPWSLALLPVAALPLVAFGTALGLWLVPLGVLYQDVARGLGLVTQFWLYLTPVVYAPPTTWPASMLNWLNPVAPLIGSVRGLVLGGESVAIAPLLVTYAVTVVLLLSGALLLRLAMPVLVERMGS